MKKFIALFVCLVLYSLFFNALPVYSMQAFSLSNFKSSIKARVASTGSRDTMPVRVAKGESCVQASEARGKEIAMIVKSMQYRGTFGYYGAKIGTLSGWDPSWAKDDQVGYSVHTYNVVEIYDGAGNVVDTIDVDNYLGPVYISGHERVNWNAIKVNLIEDIPPLIKSVSISGPKEANMGDNVRFDAIIDAQQWFKPYIKYNWMYFGGVKTLSVSDVLKFRVTYPAPHPLIVYIYHEVNGEYIDLGAARFTMKVNPNQATSGRSYTGRKYTSSYNQQQIPSAKQPSVPQLPDKVKDTFDIFKKAGELFNR